jgi:hypothetical protein
VQPPGEAQEGKPVDSSDPLSPKST